MDTVGSTDLIEPDPGPLARFVAVTGDPTTPGVLVSRLIGGETLKEVARAWGIPYRRLVGWVAANAELSAQCKRAMELAGIELRLEGLEIVDGVEGAESTEAIAAAKLRAEYRERMSRDLNRPLFGKQVKHEHEHTFDLGEQLRRAMQREKDERVVLELPPTDVHAGDSSSASGGATLRDGIRGEASAESSAAPRQEGHEPRLVTAESRRPPQSDELI